MPPINQEKIRRLTPTWFSSDAAKPSALENSSSDDTGVHSFRYLPKAPDPCSANPDVGTVAPGEVARINSHERRVAPSAFAATSESAMRAPWTVNMIGLESQSNGSFITDATLFHRRNHTFSFKYIMDCVMACCATIGLTIYLFHQSAKDETLWIDRSRFLVLFILAVTAPLSLPWTASLAQRDSVCTWTADFRNWSYQIYMAHCLCDWSTRGKGEAPVDVAEMEKLKHCDQVLKELLGVGKDLFQFWKGSSLALDVGRLEGDASINRLSHCLDEQMLQRRHRLATLRNRLTEIGLLKHDLARIHEFELSLFQTVDRFRMERALRPVHASLWFHRVLCLLLSLVTAPTIAHIAKATDSLILCLFCEVAIVLGLFALFGGRTADLEFDGVDMHKELGSFLFNHLAATRKLVFPSVAPFGLDSPTSVVALE